MIKELTICASVLTANVALGQDRCLSRDAMIQLLAKDYNELQIARGMTREGVMEFFVSAHGETWTIVITRRSGDELLACVVADGAALETWTIKRPGA